MSVKTTAGATPTKTENARMQIRGVNDAEWTELPGLAGINVNPGEAPTRENITFQKTTQFSGLPGPGTVEAQIAAAVVAHSSYRKLREVYKEGGLMYFRWQFQDRMFLVRDANREVSIDADGDVTFSVGQTHPKWGIGHFQIGSVLRTGADAASYVYHDIESFDANGLPECGPTDPAVVDAPYDVLAPPVYQPEFLANVNRYGGIQAAVNSELGDTLMLVPEDVLPDTKVGRIIG